MRPMMRHLVGAVAVLAAAAVGSPATASAQDIQGFLSPTGNIACMIDSTFVRCDIIDRDWPLPPRPADCPDFTDFGQGISLAADGGAGFVCAGDTTFDPSRSWTTTKRSRPVRCAATAASTASPVAT